MELIDASIAYLKGKPFELYPDFPTGGIMDVSAYNDGARGGRVRVRAKITQVDKATLCITEIPFSTTTDKLQENIVKASEKGKIKIKKVEDNTAKDVAIMVHLPNGISPDKTIDALYAFTDCEISISPIGCVIEDNKPHFLGVSEMLRRSTDSTVEILKEELEVALKELETQWHLASLEKIFIREEMYIDFKNYSDRESLYQYLYKRFEPFKKDLLRAIVDDDLQRLTQIPMIRITRFDSFKADENIAKIEADIEEVKNHLAHLVDYAIAHFERLKKTYAKGKERRTEIRTFDTIEATKVVVRNMKLYVNREEGFVGTGLKKDEYIGDCSDIDDVIVFTESGAMYVAKVSEKQYFEKGIIHAAVFKRDDKRTIYNMIYKDGTTGFSYIKRFNVTGITRDKQYSLIPAHKDSRVLYFTANPNGEAEVVTVNLRQAGSIRKLKWDIDFADTLIKGRAVKGNLVSKFAIKRIELKEKGVSTLKPRKIWFDDIVKRLNTDERGRLLGAFKGDDRMLLITKEGQLKTIIPELSLHFENNILVMEKWVPEKPISVIYYDGEKERVFVKRFVVENENREETIISEHPKSQLLFVSTEWRPMAQVVFTKEKGKDKEPLTVNLEEFIAVKGIKALGNQLTTDKVKEVKHLEPLPYEEPVEEELPVEAFGDEEMTTPEEPTTDGTQTELTFGEE